MTPLHKTVNSIQSFSESELPEDLNIVFEYLRALMMTFMTIGCEFTPQSAKISSTANVNHIVNIKPSHIGTTSKTLTKR